MGNNESSKNSEYTAVPTHQNDSNLPVADPFTYDVIYSQDAALAQRLSVEDDLASAAWDEYHNATYRYSAWSRPPPPPPRYRHPPAVVVHQNDDPEDLAVVLCLTLWLFFFFVFFFFLLFWYP